MGWTDRLQAVAKSALTQNLMPALEAVREKVGPAALAAAKDDETLTEILKVGYLAIPMPLQPGTIYIGRGDADLRFLKIVRRESNRMKHRAARRPLRTINHDR